VIPFDDAGRTRGQPDAAKTPVAHFGADCRAGLDWLSIHPKVAPVKIGVVGFCIGGHPAAALAMDPKQGSLWLGFLRSGIVNLKDGEVRASYTAADGLGEGRVNDLRFDPGGALWVATEGGLNRLKNGRIATLSSKNGLPCDSVHWVVEDDAHAFWLVTPCGVLRIDRPELEAWAAAVDGIRMRMPSGPSNHGIRQFGRDKEPCFCWWLHTTRCQGRCRKNLHDF
jgi:dienelactone hydrolase